MGAHYQSHFNPFHQQYPIVKHGNKVWVRPTDSDSSPNALR
jgi:hypothetical protein